jgi:preprotein translocase subunit SecD
MADRLSGMGIRDFSVQAQGGDIMVEPPRTNNGAQVLKALAQTGQLFFRPVDCILAPYVGARPGATTETPSEGTTTGPPGAGTSRASAICRLNSTEQKLYAPSHGNIHGVTPATYDTAGTTAVLADYAGYAYGRYVLGPAEMTGAIIKTAVANLNSHTNRWEVDNSMTPAGLALFNKYAAAHYACYAQDESNPHIAR